MGKFISLFAGVGGFDLGMEQAGHECVAQVEWDKNAAGVLKHRWPNVPLFCDVSKVSADDLPDADFITYGFPCQDLSVAGKREGLDGKRSGLFYEATRLIRELRSRGCGLRFAVAENVGGLLSADDGLALARCIRELLDCGACETGWRVLDSQYFGVAQRRKRVFIVSDFGGESVDEILAITESLPGYPAPSRETGKGTAGDAGAGFTASSFGGYEQGCGTLRSQGGDLGGGSETLAVNAAFSDGSQYVNDNKVIVEGVDWYNNAVTGDVNHTLKIGGDVPGVIEQKETYCLQGGGETSQSSQGSGVNKDVAFTLNGLDKHGVAYEDKKSMSFAPSDLKRGFGQKPEIELSGTLKKAHNDQSPHVATYEWHNQDSRIREQQQASTLSCNAGGKEGNLVRENLTVRRLTPIECERLQGFPDNWTSEKMELILEGNEWKATGKVVKQADGPRYKAMGNAVTVNVAEWIGKQIGKVLNETK
jgi:DNA (cytosine-5)-methyltransferase 1